MNITLSLLSKIEATIESGYYERLAPAHRQRRSVAERIEAMHGEGKLPLLLEMKCADPMAGQLFPTRDGALRALLALGDIPLAAYSAWVEPKMHAGDLKWLRGEFSAPLIAKDCIISERQIVGGDAVLLSMPLLEAAGADSHRLIEFAHGRDFEVVLEAYTQEQFEAARKTEADVLAINNFGHNGSAEISTTIDMLSRAKSGRPIISCEGISSPAHVRALLSSGASAIEVGPQVWSAKDGKARIGQLCKAVGGKGPPLGGAN